MPLARIAPCRCERCSVTALAFTRSITLPSQLEIIEYEALKILFRSQQYATFCELVDGLLPHMISPWRHTMVLDWYLHCASCWGAGDLQKTIEVAKLLENEPSYWDRGRIVNFVFDTILVIYSILTDTRRPAEPRVIPSRRSSF